MNETQADFRDDHERLATLISDYQRRLYLYVYSLVHRTEDAYDVLQETNLALWRDADRVEAVADFRSWAHRVAFNQVLAYRKRRGRDRLHFDEALLARLADDMQSQVDQITNHQTVLRLCATNAGTEPTPACDAVHVGAVRESDCRTTWIDGGGRFQVAVSDSRGVEKMCPRCLEQGWPESGIAAMSTRDKSCREFEPTAEMTVWIESLIDGDITAEQHAALTGFLREDRAARRYFLDELQLHAALKWDGIERLDNSVEVASGKTHSAPIFPFLSSTTLHDMVGFFSSGWPVAYLIATVIFGVGLLIGSLVPVSQPAQVARQSSVPSRVDAEPRMEPVGRITGMVDCQWEKGAGVRVQGSAGEDQKSEIRNQKSLVALGDKFPLASGLMEITYNTGARVILQGPVTYEVESTAGGYLSVGKLTARLENAKPQAADSKSPSPESQSPIPNPSSFVCRPHSHGHRDRPGHRVRRRSR